MPFLLVTPERDGLSQDLSVPFPDFWTGLLAHQIHNNKHWQLMALTPVRPWIGMGKNRTRWHDKREEVIKSGHLKPGAAGWQTAPEVWQIIVVVFFDNRRPGLIYGDTGGMANTSHPAERNCSSLQDLTGLYGVIHSSREANLSVHFRANRLIGKLYLTNKVKRTSNVVTSNGRTLYHVPLCE